ncbi:MAG: flagellar biosynthesis anti-sigma factor FlgM [Christensenellales bacterium]|jgi:anti-sigma28 factor (negative regulator of flagellin synthesis)
MKIDSVNQQIMIKKYMSGARIREDRGKSTPARDKVELSDNAVAFASVMKTARGVDVSRTADELREIEEITRQVRAGTFSVSGRDIADKMLETMLADLGM